MPNNWRTYKLKDIVDQERGISYGIVQPGPYDPNGIPILKVNNLTGLDFDRSQMHQVSEKIDKSYSRTRLKGGELLVSLVGTLGEVYMVPESLIGVNVVRALAVLPVLNEFSPKWVMYWLRSPFAQNQLKQMATTSVQATINLKELREIEIPFPEINNRQAIASILSALDDKIELNLQMNKTLEEMAMTLYKHWFVDFGPFKDGKFVDSELGLIPEGWEVKRLEELFSVKDGTHDSPKQKDEGHYLITSKHIKKNEIDFSNAYKISGEDYLKVNQRSKVENGDILMTMIGTVGVFHLVNGEPDYAIKNLGLFKTSENKTLRYYIYLFFNSAYGSQYIKSQLAGSTQQYLTLKVLRGFPCLHPSQSVVKEFDNQVSHLFERISTSIHENQTLTSLRDTLLPKLISGEVQVKDVEKTIAEVL